MAVHVSGVSRGHHVEDEPEQVTPPQQAACGWEGLKGAVGSARILGGEHVPREGST